MIRQRGRIVLTLVMCVVLGACGQVLPTTVSGGGAAPAATTGGPPGVSPAPTDPAEAEIHRVEQAAMSYGRTVLRAPNSEVSALSQGSFAPGDPNGTVWIVQLSRGPFRLTPCPTDLTPTSYAMTCGTGTVAKLGLRQSDLHVVAVNLFNIPATPIAQLDVGLPPDAVLKTREDAIKAALKNETDANGQAPHVVSVDLILAGQVEDLNNFAPDTPLWQVVLDHGEFGFSCPPDVAERMPCVSSTVTRYLDAMTGDLRVESFGPP